MSQPRLAEPRYREIARRLAREIEIGVHAVGARLPSVRALVATHGVSVTTASRVLVELEAEGWAEARPRSGFYVADRAASRDAPRPTATVADPAPVDVNRLIGEIFRAGSAAASGRPVLALGAAELDERLLPHGELAAATRHVLREEGAGLLAYGAPAGEPALRRRIAALMARRGVNVAPDDIVVTAGEGDAMGTALAAVSASVPTSADGSKSAALGADVSLSAALGAAVAVESPCFFGILQWIERLGLRAVTIATDPRRGIDLDALERVAAEVPLAAVALNPTFHNPFGFAMPPARMERLLAIAARFDLTVIEDDVYGELHHGLGPARPLKAFDRDGRVIYCSSFSKTLAPGHRVGWCVPGRAMAAFAQARAPQTAGIGTLPQLALARFLEGRGFGRHLAGLRALFAEQRPRVRALVLEHFPPGTRVSDPAGGFVFWVEVPPPFEALAFHRAALAEGISVAPGAVFSPGGAGFAGAFRLSVGRRLDGEVADGIARLGRLAATIGA
jgi:DNA-binding transcriptional MocR family regulator